MLKSVLSMILVGTGLLAKAQCSYTVNVSTVDATCHNSPTGSATANVVGVGPFTYSWNTNPPQSGPSISNVEGGNYTLTVTDNNNCVTSHLFTIAEPVTLTMDIGNDTVVCAGTTFQAKSVVSGGTQPYAYLWSCNQQTCQFDDNLSSAPQITVSQSGLYFLQVTDNNGCAVSDFYNVQVQASPTVNAGSDATIYLGDDIQLSATGNSSQGTYSWSPGSTLDNSQIANPVATPGALTTYTVTFTDATGCTATDAVTIDVNTTMAIATGLTPNGDNVNDTWGVKGLVNFPNMKAEVFNRFGDRVYEGFAGDAEWDGTFKNNTLPAGTYYYFIDLGDGSDPLSGILTLIR